MGGVRRAYGGRNNPGNVFWVRILKGILNVLLVFSYCRFPGPVLIPIPGFIVPGFTVARLIVVRFS